MQVLKTAESSITVLAAQLKAASERHQVIVSTQSVELVNEFEADDLVVVNRQRGETVFERTSEDKIKSWLEDYSLGEIWKKNLIGGGGDRRNDPSDHCC